MLLYESAVAMMSVSASAGMSRKKVNEIAKMLIPRYQDKLMHPPRGKSFRECYDLQTLKPAQEWFDMYLRVKKELVEFGVPLEHM
jgi:methylamine--corrinoid protein Co-methyltransferase